MDKLEQTTPDGKYRIYQTSELILIKHNDYDKYLQFDLKQSSNTINTNFCSEVTKDSLNELVLTENKIRPHAIIGLLNLDKLSVILLVTKCDLVGKINNKEIYTVKEIDYVPISNELNVITTDIKRYLDGLSALFLTGYYYSFDYNLTLSLQASKNQKPDTKNLNESLYYNFNHNLKKELESVNPIFKINMINGYVGINTGDLGGEDVTLILISRRSKFMAGTVFNCRGIDENGDTANFVETEQIMKIGNKTFSFLIYRGSQPLFIKQNKSDSEYSIKLNDEITKEENAKVLNKHIDKITLKEQFNIFFLNLLSDNIPDEAYLNKSMQNSFFPEKTSNGEICKYTRFDFKNSLEMNEFNMLENFSKSFIKNQNAFLQYFCDDTKFKSSIMQKGVIRVNCMNSLDRTNVMQASLCWNILDTQVIQFIL